MALQSKSRDLDDLVRLNAELDEPESGIPKGSRLVKRLGRGAHSAVYLCQLGRDRRATRLSVQAPDRVALKFMVPGTAAELNRQGQDPELLFKKEVEALERVMRRTPPSEFVIHLFGHGKCSVEIDSGDSKRTRTVPWLALEYVDGGTSGTTLRQRAESSEGGFDPVRAARLVRGLIEGVRTLHHVNVVHKDLKPENILVTGPIDDETPKIADCGIARVANDEEGAGLGTTGALSMLYAATEQFCSLPAERNPLIGAHTDVHALACVIWFVFAGMDWCPGQNDPGWMQGIRRSLGALDNENLKRRYGPYIPQLDAILSKATAGRVPQQCLKPSGQPASQMAQRTVDFYTRMTGSLPRLERYETVNAMAADLLPLLAQVEREWKDSSARECRAATVLRSTKMLSPDDLVGVPRVQVEEFAPGAGVDLKGLPAAESGNVLFRQDGCVIARFGTSIVYFVRTQPDAVKFEPGWQSYIETSRWIVRAPNSGFSVIGPRSAVVFRETLSLSNLPSCEEYGPVCGTLAAADVMAIATSGIVGDTAPKLWVSNDGIEWVEHCEISGVTVRGTAAGPYGYMIVGSSMNKKEARALFVGASSGNATGLGWVKAFPPLDVAVGSTEREFWAAGKGLVVRIDPSTQQPSPSAAKEEAEVPDTPVAMALDLIGIPWLVLPHAVLRRHAAPGQPPRWPVYYHRDSSRPPLAGVGFMPDGAWVMDARGGFVHIVPQDLDRWKSGTDTGM